MSAVSELTLQWEEAYSKQIRKVPQKTLKDGRVENAEWRLQFTLGG